MFTDLMINKHDLHAMRDPGLSGGLLQTAPVLGLADDPAEHTPFQLQ